MWLVREILEAPKLFFNSGSRAGSDAKLRLLLRMGGLSGVELSEGVPMSSSESRGISSLS
jgi:hypothetical protein